jgi:hypothetical protein
MKLEKYHSLGGAFFFLVARFGSSAASATTFFSGIATGGCELGTRLIDPVHAGLRGHDVTFEKITSISSLLSVSRSSSSRTI